MTLSDSNVIKNQSRLTLIRDLIIHLRLHFQFFLMPIFLWGYFLTGHSPDRDFWLGLLVSHFFLAAGITAYNSYYDRDEGPIGGLAHPPLVSQALLPFSLAIQLFGLGLAAFVNLSFFVICLITFGLGLAYSHPRIRLKGRPLAGLATVALGQGILAALAGWVCARPDLTTLDGLSGLGILAVTLITTGFYPLTQVYQLDEDRARGDVTFAVWAGPRGVFIFALTVQSLAAILLAGVVSQLLGPLEAMVVSLFYGLLLAATVQWARTFDSRRVLDNYRRIMRLNGLTSIGFMGFIIIHLFGIG